MFSLRTILRRHLRGGLAAMAASSCLAITPFRLHANGPEVGFDAGGVVPLASQDVQLVSEIVDVGLPGCGSSTYGSANCTYQLKNLSASPRTISMGFLTSNPRGQDAHVVVYRDGTRLSVQMRPLTGSSWEELVTPPPDSLPVWDVGFGPGELVSIVITSQVSWSGGCEGDGVPDVACGFEFKYLARAARLWAGAIERAQISITLDRVVNVLMRCNPAAASCLNIKATPQGFRQDASGFHWSLENWEPTEDFRVSLDWKVHEP